MQKWLALAVCWGSVLGCVDGGRGAEYEPPDTLGKDDSQRNPTDHGPLAFDVAQVAEISADARFHAWQFDLTGNAQIEAWTTYAVRGQRRVDTVMYLYRERIDSNGTPKWGPYIARNDDDGARPYSRLVRSLDAGRYRVLVKGYAATTRGRFAIELSCAGDGCAATPQTCVFGDTYQSAFATPGLTAQDTTTLRESEVTQIAEFDKARLVTAVQQSSHTDVTTWQEALARVDGGEINRTFFVDEAGRRTFVAYEYGVGDNSYGAFFNHHTDELVSAIHDGDLVACTARSEICELPATFVDFGNDPAWADNGQRYVSVPSEFTDTEAAQALVALRSVYGAAAVPDVAAGLAMADEGSLRVVNLLHLATGTDLTAIEFGAGSTSVGQLFYGTSRVPAGTISDLQIENCSFFRATAQASMPAGAPCRATSECRPDLQCEGVFANAGVCVANDDIPGVGAECSTDAACSHPDLICAGATRGAGSCSPRWMRGTFADANETQLAAAGATERAVIVRGLATVDTDVTLTLTVDHSAPAELRITLLNPGGTEAVVFEGNASHTGSSVVLEHAVVGFSGDESVNGQWLLRITDSAAGNAGTLRGWSLGVTSRWD